MDDITTTHIHPPIPIPTCAWPGENHEMRVRGEDGLTLLIVQALEVLWLLLR